MLARVCKLTYCYLEIPVLLEHFRDCLVDPEGDFDSADEAEAGAEPHGAA